MSFAGILGAGLLGGTANAAKGIGNRIRAEAKQKREFALQDRADKKAQDREATAQINRLAVLSQQQDFTGGENQKSRDFTGGENQKGRDFTGSQNSEGYAARLEQIKASQVNTVETFYDKTTGMQYKAVLQADGTWKQKGGTEAVDASKSKGFTLQTAYNEGGEEIKGYMSGQSFVQVGGAKAIKAETPEQARAYFTGQAKYILGGAPNPFMAAKLTDDDTKLMNEWIPEAEAAFKANPKTSLSQIVKNIMFKPWVLDDMDITDDDLSAGKAQASAAGSDALTPMQYARQIATKRQPDFIKAQDKYNAFKANNRDPEPVLKMMIKMGYDPDLLIK